MKKKTDEKALDRVVEQSRRESELRAHSFRELALKLFPWVCGRCGREFTRKNLTELTVHHRDHDHDNNPPDGSNWELLCIYCHENEHARHGEKHEPIDAAGSAVSIPASTHKPFADLGSMLKGKKL